MAHPTVRDILIFHKIDRAVYDKFVTHGMKPDTARIAVALFMWLDQLCIGMIDQIAQITVTDPTMIFPLIAEANAVLHCLRHGLSKWNGYTEIPLITTLAKDSIDIHFFNCHKVLTVRGLAHILDGVGRDVFGDYRHSLLLAYESEEAAARAGLRAVMPAVPLELAALYVTEPLVEDARSMFFNFTKDIPITKEEILEYFTERWGDCIDRVIESRPKKGKSDFGRIVFKSDTYINLLLNGERDVKCIINEKSLWVRKYVPRVAQKHCACVLCSSSDTCRF